MTLEEFNNLQPGALLKLTAEIYSAENRRWDYYNLGRFVTFVGHLPRGSQSPADYTYIIDETLNKNKAFNSGKAFYCAGTFLIDDRMRTIELALYQLELVK